MIGRQFYHFFCFSGDAKPGGDWQGSVGGQTDQAENLGAQAFSRNISNVHKKAKGPSLTRPGETLEPVLLFLFKHTLSIQSSEILLDPDRPRGNVGLVNKKSLSVDRLSY